VAQVVEHLPTKCVALSSNRSTKKKKITSGHACWYTSVIPALGRLSQEDPELKVSPGYITPGQSGQHNETLSQFFFFLNFVVWDRGLAMFPRLVWNFQAQVILLPQSLE
jgi:hypothetical protein